MSRIIQTQSGGQFRKNMLKYLASALKAMNKKEKIDNESKDIIAFIVLCLEKISVTIDESVVAWEKRGYWVKADKFRLEWEWARKCAQGLRIQLMQEDWVEIQFILDTVSKRCKTISNIKQRNDAPWEGAYSILGRGK